MDFLKELTALANELDIKGAYEEASMLDDALRTFAQNPPQSYLERSRQTSQRLKDWSQKRDQTRQQRVQQQPAAPAQQPQAQQAQPQQQQAPAQPPVPPPNPQQVQQDKQDQARLRQIQEEDRKSMEQHRKQLKQRIKTDVQDARKQRMDRARQQADRFEGAGERPDEGAGRQMVELKPQPGAEQAAGKQPKKRKMSPKARKQWAQHYKNMATTMGLETSNPKAVFRAIQKKYPGLYQKGMTAKQLYDAVSKRELSGQTSGGQQYAGSTGPDASTQPVPVA